MADPVLVIGAGGFVGSRLSQALTARGERVFWLLRLPNLQEEYLAWTWFSTTQR